MFCPKCGTQVDNDSKFCNGCGTKIIKEVKLNDLKEEVKKKSFISKEVGRNIFIVFIICILVLVVGTICNTSVQSTWGHTKSSFACAKCKKEKSGSEYYAKANRNMIICEECIEIYYPTNWTLYFEKR